MGDLPNPEQTLPVESQPRLGAVLLQSLMTTNQTAADMSRQNDELNKNSLTRRESVKNHLKNVDSRLTATQQQQENLQTTANQLAESLKAALLHLEQNRLKHEDIIQRNDQAVANLIEHSQVLWGRNRALGE